MPENSDYRLFLDERFNGLTTSMNGQFKEVHERLDKIEKQTTKTNGRVTEVEDWQKKHCNEEETEEKIIERKRAKRNEFIKTASLIVITIGVIIAAISSLSNKSSIKSQANATRDSLKHEIRMTKGIPNITRGGWLIVNHNGLTDSVKVLNIPKDVLK